MTLPPPDARRNTMPDATHDAAPSLPGQVERRDVTEPFRVPFTVFDAVMTLLWFFLGQLVVGAAIAVVAGIAGVALDESAWVVVALVATAVGLGAGLLWLRGRHRLDWRLLGPVRPGMLGVALGVAAGLVGTILAYTVNGALVAVFDPQSPVEQQLLQDALTGGGSLVIVLVTAVVVAPIAEEVLFRGVLFQAVRNRGGFWPAATVSSAVFALIHVEIVASQPLALVGLFTFGLVLAWSFHKAGSLVVPIVAHAVFNALVITFLLIADRLGLV